MNILKQILLLLVFCLPLNQFSADTQDKVEHELNNNSEKLENITFSLLSKKKFIKLVKEQIKKNKVNFSDSNTPALIYATKQNYTEAVTLLIQNKANLNIQNYFKNTALIIAAKKHLNHIAKWLINNKANLNLQNKKGQTALMYAVRYNNIEIVKMLICHKADLEIQDDNYLTALLHALLNCNFDIAQLLIDNGANIKNNNGKIVLLDILKNIKNNSEYTQLQESEKEKMDKILKLSEYLQKLHYNLKEILINYIHVNALTDIILDYIF